MADSYPARFAAGDRPESFDKDFVRSWVAHRCDPYKDPIPEIPADLIAGTAEVYIRAYEMITGQTFRFPRPARSWSASAATCAGCSRRRETAEAGRARPPVPDQPAFALCFSISALTALADCCL